MIGAALLLSSTVAVAAIKIGTNGDDRIRGTDSADQINGKGGNDRLNGKAGNDTYYFADGFGVDTLIDSAGTDTLNFSRLTTGVEVYLIPEWGPDWNAAYNGNNQVNMGSSVIENAIGGSGKDFIYGGKDQNTLRPGNGDKDELWDYGGYPGNSSYVAIPVSDDTYKGFTSSSGTDYVVDWGGSADTIDLRSFDSSEVYFDAVDLNGNGTNESLLLLTGDNSGVIVVGHFINYYAGQEGHVEQIMFADGTFNTDEVQQAQAKAFSAAADRNDKRAEAAKKLVSKAKAPKLSESLKQPNSGESSSDSGE